MIEIFSRLPWWVCFVLAVISYFIMHHYSIKPGVPVDTAGLQVGTMGAFVVKQMWQTFAFFGQIVVPALFGIAGLASGIRTIKSRRNAARG